MLSQMILRCIVERMHTCSKAYRPSKYSRVKGHTGGIPTLIPLMMSATYIHSRTSRREVRIGRAETSDIPEAPRMSCCILGECIASLPSEPRLRPDPMKISAMAKRVYEPRTHRTLCCSRLSSAHFYYREYSRGLCESQNGYNLCQTADPAISP